MIDTEASERPEGPFGRILRWLTLAAGWVLMALLFYTVLDVALRYIFNTPFRGSLEFTQFLMSVIVFLGLAYCGWTGGHVAVDIFVKPLESRALRFIPPLLLFVSAVLFAVIAWYSLQDGLQNMRRVSNMLRWPYYPFVFITAFGCAAYALVLFVQSARAWRNQALPNPKDGDPKDIHV
jgi:TRAP-type C4-dicarboxylate transport system permease small subunit